MGSDVSPICIFVTNTSVKCLNTSPNSAVDSVFEYYLNTICCKHMVLCFCVMID